MPMSNSEQKRYRCANCLHRHYWTKGKTFTLVDGKRVVKQETNLGSWGQCEDENCTCISLHRLTANQLEDLLDRAETYCGRPIGHRPPGVVIPNEPQREGATSSAGRDAEPPAADVGF